MSDDTADICGAGEKPPRMFLTSAAARVRHGFADVGATSAMDAEAAASTNVSRSGANLIAFVHCDFFCFFA
jgi:hypothetical protein